jgi:beta-barrel assembly-enhancing protease
MNDRRDFLKAGLLGFGAASILGSCKAIEVGANIAMQAGGISADQASSIINTSKAIAKTFEDFTPEQEYYIGRTVSANIYSKYKPYNHPAQSAYLNAVGNAIVIHSDTPETYGGYHFALLDTDEINAFAAPGGLIFVTRGMIHCCETEDALAAVLAHEVSHVQLKHGLQAIKSSRITDAITIIASETAKTLSGQELKQLVDVFEGSISDITSTMINNGYSRTAEEEADAMALILMQRTGYSLQGMKSMLSLMDTKLKPGGTDFFKTHPSPRNRLELLNSKLDSPAKIEAVRTQRFKTATASI